MKTSPFKLKVIVTNENSEVLEQETFTVHEISEVWAAQKLMEVLEMKFDFEWDPSTDISALCNAVKEAE